MHEAIGRRLLAGEQRYSRGRRALVEVLARASRPMTSPEIVRGDGALSLSSVYRNLSTLEAAGVVRRLVTDEDSARYELAEQYTAHHHHLICDRCGDVLDYEAPPTLEKAMDRGLASLPRATGFRPRTHKLEILGSCASCTEASD